MTHHALDQVLHIMGLIGPEDTFRRPSQVNGHESVEPVTSRENDSEVGADDDTGMSRGNISWMAVENAWNELVDGGADPDALHELIVHAINYVQHEARVMSFHDFAVLRRVMGGDK